MRPTTPSYHYLPLEHGRTTGLANVSDANRITTISVLLLDRSTISSLQMAIGSLPTIPQLQALHIVLGLGDEAIDSVVYRLLRAAENSLLSFHPSTPKSILRNQLSINLPKLQHFLLD